MNKYIDKENECSKSVINKYIDKENEPSPSGTFFTPPNIFGISAFTPLSAYNPTSSMHYRPTMPSPASHNEANNNDDEHVVDDPLPQRPRRQIRKPHCGSSSHKSFTSS